MKLKILKTELTLQILVIFACFIWFGVEQLKNDNSFILLNILIILAVSNILGFLIRIFTYKSNLMTYYFFGVIVYLLILVAIGSIDNTIETVFFKIYLFGGSLVISLYYTLSGFFIIKQLRSDSKIN